MKVVTIVSITKWTVGMLLWLLTVVFLLLHFGFQFSHALIDTCILTVLLCASIFLLDKVFAFITPQGKNQWLIWSIPALFAGTITLLHAKFIHPQILGALEIEKFWERAIPLTLFTNYLILLAFSIILNISGRLKDQLSLQEMEHAAKNLAKEAELYFIRQQIQPHFLFNALNSINALIGFQPEKAREMIMHLSDFLRSMVSKNHQSFVSLDQELVHIKQYLNIEIVRFGHRLKVSFDVSDDAQKHAIPPLLLQPLVENAIKHGLYGTTGEVPITLSASIVQSMLIIQVSNPFDPEYKVGTGTGFGLEGTARRLQLLFGRNDLLKVKKDANVFTVTVKIPEYHD